MICNYTVLWVYSQAIKINIGAYLFLFLVINSFKGRPFSGPKNNESRSQLCHAPWTNGFTSPPKDVAQDAPTHWV